MPQPSTGCGRNRTPGTTFSTERENHHRHPQRPRPGAVRRTAPTGCRHPDPAGAAARPRGRMTEPIESYGMIGDCQTAALVGRDGSIDWLCWPRFDSDACFAALLGTPDNGRWLIAPEDANAKVCRRYRDTTLILETRFETASGSVVVIDFMPLRDEAI